MKPELEKGFFEVESYDEHDFENDLVMYDVKNFGILHPSVDQASELIAKIICLEGMSDVKLPDIEENYSLFNPELPDLLKKDIEFYKNALVKGIDESTLETVRIYRNIDETLDTEATFISFETLCEWLEKRNTSIYGDWYQEYFDQEMRVIDSVIHAIKLERYKIKNNIRKNFSPQTHDDKIEELEKYALKLERFIDQNSIKKVSNHPIGNREKETYQNIIGALLGILFGKSSSGIPHSKFESQQVVIDMIHNTYGDRFGLSKRNLETKFSESKRTIKSNYPDDE